MQTAKTLTRRAYLPLTTQVTKTGFPIPRVAIHFAVRQECHVPTFFSLMEQELLRLHRASKPGPLLGESQNNSLNEKLATFP